MNIKISDSVFHSFPELESERLVFREFNSGDAEDMYSMRSDDRILKFLDSPKHNNIQDSMNLIESFRSSFRDKSGITWAIVLKTNQNLIGYFGFWRLIREHCRAEIGYVLKPEFWGQGYMAETFSRLFDFGFSELLVHSLEANVNPRNLKSIAVLEKAGFRQEAYFRENFLFENKFYDSLIFAMIESDFYQKNNDHPDGQSSALK